MLYFKSRQTKVPLKHGAGSRGGSATQIELTIDQTYSAKSLNAQAGKAVAEAIDQTNTKLMSRMGGVLHFRGTTSLKGLDYLEPQIGDVYNIDQPGDYRDGSNYVWTGKEWDKLSQSLDHLAAHADFETLQSTINTHKNNQDGNAMHLDAAGYSKFSQIEIFDSSDINDFLDDIIEQYISEGKLVTTNSFKQTVNEVIQRIEESIIQAVTGDVASNFLTKSTLDAYRTEVQNKLAGHLKSAEADEIKFYKKTDNIPSLDSRTAKVLYLVEEDGISRSVEGGQMVLTVNTTANNNTVNFGPILGKWDGAANAIATSGLLDWGDGSAIVQLTNNMGETNSLLSHTYATPGEHKITLSGKLKWNGTRVNQNGGASPTDTTLCSQLYKIEIPEGQISPIYRAKAHGFHNCKHITTVPAGLFDNAGETTSFEQLFDSCAALTSIPEHLFDHCINVTNFTNAFLKTAISNIPADLFKNCTNVTTFHACFNNCKHLTTIPKDLFAYCIKVTFFDYCFAGCSNITQIPENLFATNTKAVSFNHTFANCTSLTSIPSNIFEHNTQINHLIECFNNCTAITGELPELWISHPTIVLANHSKCFCGCTQATNYQKAINAGYTCPDDIPEAEYGKMILHIDVPTNTANINLGYQLGHTTEVYESITVEGTIDWGDDSELVHFEGNEGYSATNNILVHTYSKGEHKITIDGRIFWGGITSSDGRYNTNILYYLTKIEIPTGSKSPIYNIGGNAFQYASKLIEIPANLFEKCIETTYFGSCFYACTSLTSIPKGLFDNCIKATRFFNTFKYCTSLTSIPEDLFAKCPEAFDFQNCFEHCTSLTSIPEALFLNNKNATRFESCFEGCNMITLIPENLFEPCTLVTNFDLCFNGCTKLQNIPNKLFEKCIHVLSFSSCFANCTHIQNIPENLFATCIVTNNFAFCFNGCTMLSKIPVSLFAHNDKTNDCQGIFSGCTLLTSIPETLFDKCTELETLDYCFDGCTNLQTIPNNLFSKNTKLYSIISGFEHCTSLTSIPEILFSSCPDINHFDLCFNGCSSVTSNLPKLWETHKKVSSYDSCFCGCNTAINYQDAVNAGWACSDDVPIEGGGDGVNN